MSTGLWNICKNLVFKMLYKILSTLQIVIFCRPQIIGQLTLILLFDFFVSVYHNSFSSMISYITISTGTKYYTYRLWINLYILSLFITVDVGKQGRQ